MREVSETSHRDGDVKLESTGLSEGSSCHSVPVLVPRADQV